MIYIFLADGFEEIEAIVPRDILRRGGVDVLTVGVTGDVVESAYGLKVETDITIENVNLDDIDGILLPGGMPGTTNLENSERVLDIIKYCFENKLLIGAICAAPSILGGMGVLQSKTACCYPGFEKYLKGASVSNESVAIDQNIITSKGPGTAMNFGFALLSYLKGKESSDSAKSGMIYKG
ncbi:MAG: DJ-1/PfpI family protein [Clostridia bacterium]|nr:DJ-1/PfpI family protein [Clostridia bacterium]MBR2735052.1 DJ-1/PfpI family protein [Clostridia bacterium]